MTDLRPISALVALAGFCCTVDETFFVTRYRGWESEAVLLEELLPDRLEPVLLDGLDYGC